MINENLIGWALAALSYDEDNVIDKIKELFPKFKSHFKYNNKYQSHFYGIVIDEENKRCFIVNRGTDAKKGNNKIENAIGTLQSWKYDLSLLTGDDDVHNGFQKLGNAVIDNKEFKDYLYKWNNRCVVVGHSQGASCAQYILCLLGENFPSVKEIKGYVFAAAPSGKKLFYDRYNKLANIGRISLDRYVTVRDPIDSNVLRNPNSLFLNGVDIGNEIMLPEIIKYDLKLANVINHSCQVYNASLLQMCAANSKYSLEDIRMLGKVGEMIIN